jgi:hypothetical protein
VSRLKASKLDQNVTYPCPCRKQGELCPIALTEALGCDRCNHIFVIRADGYTLEQLSSAHPHKQLWYWTGREWNPVRPSFYSHSCTWIVVALFVFFIVLLCLPIAFKIPFDRHVVVWMVLTICIAVMLSFIVWFTMQRRF